MDGWMRRRNRSGRSVAPIAAAAVESAGRNATRSAGRREKAPPADAGSAAAGRPMKSQRQKKTKKSARNPTTAAAASLDSPNTLRNPVRSRPIKLGKILLRVVRLK